MRNNSYLHLLQLWNVLWRCAQQREVSSLASGDGDWIGGQIGCTCIVSINAMGFSIKIIDQPSVIHGVYADYYLLALTPELIP